MTPFRVQRRQIAGWALQNGRHLSKVFVEQGSQRQYSPGRAPARSSPNGTAPPRRHRDRPKLDRAFRSALDGLHTLQHLESIDVDLVLLDMGGSVIKGGISKLMFALLSAFANFERDRIRDRIREVKQDQKARRVFAGAPSRSVGA